MNSRLFTRCQSASHTLITSVLVADSIVLHTQRTICYRVYITALNDHFKCNPFGKSVRLRYCASSLLQKHPVTECNISKEMSSQPHRFRGFKTYNPLIVVLIASNMSHCTARKYLCFVFVLCLHVQTKHAQCNWDVQYIRPHYFVRSFILPETPIWVSCTLGRFENDE